MTILVWTQIRLKTIFGPICILSRAATAQWFFSGPIFISACHNYVYNSGFWYLHLDVCKYVWNMNWMLLSSLSNIDCCKNLGCNIFRNTMVIHHSVCIEDILVANAYLLPYIFKGRERKHIGNGILLPNLFWPFIFAKMALFNPCMKFKIFFGQKHSFEALWKWQ